MSLDIYKAMLAAKNKGLIVRKSYLTGFWSIRLPNGAAHSTRSTVEMIRYVSGY